MGANAGFSYSQPLWRRLLAQAFLAGLGTCAIIYCHGSFKAIGFGFALVGYVSLIVEVWDFVQWREIAREFRRWLRGLGWPTYDCEDCIGMMIPHGCYCAGSDAVAPCEGPRNRHLIARWLHGTLFGGEKR